MVSQIHCRNIIILSLSSREQLEIVNYYLFYIVKNETNSIKLIEMKKTVEVLADKEQLIERSLNIILEQLKTALAQRDQFTLALSGGSTPKPLYEKLAALDLPLEKIHIFWGDERYVAADDAESNQLMARQAWLDQVAFPKENIHPMPTSGNDPAADAEKYDAELRQFFQVSAGEFPQFDVILLGMGDDAHTASLFPHTKALTQQTSLVTVGNKSGTPRITLTVPTINSARCVLFVVAGENKRPALAQVFAETGDDMMYPSRLIQPQGELYWLLDQAAGEEIA
jgi:6-phosphogluconolactonase